MLVDIRGEEAAVLRSFDVERFVIWGGRKGVRGFGRRLLGRLVFSVFWYQVMCLDFLGWLLV